MVARLLDISLRQRMLVVIFALMLGIGGLYSFRTIPIDAFPDVTSVLVQVVTKAPGLSPAEVERLVTYPIELQLTGVPSLTEMRSLTKVGLSLVTIVFDDTMDINLARQLVLERLIEVQELLPPGTEPMLVPNSTGLGEVFQYYLADARGPVADDAVTHQNLIDQRTIQDWIIRPLLKSTPEVIDVNSMGGFVKQYQVLVEPAMLRKYNLTLREVFDAIASNNANAGGGPRPERANADVHAEAVHIGDMNGAARGVVRSEGDRDVAVLGEHVAHRHVVRAHRSRARLEADRVPSIGPDVFDETVGEGRDLIRAPASGRALVGVCGFVVEIRPEDHRVAGDRRSEAEIVVRRAVRLRRRCDRAAHRPKSPIADRRGRCRPPSRCCALQ